MRFDHLDLNVSDLRASTTFYQAVLAPLGYQIGEAGEGWQILRGPHDYLCLVQTEVEFLEPDFHRKRIGVNHLAYAISSREGFEEYVHHLEHLRVPLLYGGPLAKDGGIACYFEDPDRLKVEIVYRPAGVGPGQHP